VANGPNIFQMLLVLKGLKFVNDIEGHLRSLELLVFGRPCQFPSVACIVTTYLSYTAAKIIFTSDVALRSPSISTQEHITEYAEYVF